MHCIEDFSKATEAAPVHMAPPTVGRNWAHYRGAQDVITPSAVCSAHTAALSTVLFARSMGHSGLVNRQKGPKRPLAGISCTVERCNE